jgi:hypothetical protein
MKIDKVASPWRPAWGREVSGADGLYSHVALTMGKRLPIRSGRSAQLPSVTKHIRHP